MAAKKKNKAEEANTAFENPEVLAERVGRTEQFLENNKTVVLGFIGVLIVVVAGIFGYRYYIDQQDQVAQANLFQAIYYFESDSLELSLNGDGNDLGFLDIIDDYGNTDAANLANFYAGSAYLKLGRFDAAIEHLQDFSSDDLLVQARAYSLLGDAHMELELYDEAAGYYEQAASFNANPQFSPVYLAKAAIAYEKNDELAEAKKCYDNIIEKYTEASNIEDAKKHSARLELKMKS